MDSAFGRIEYSQDERQTWQKINIKCEVSFCGEVYRWPKIFVTFPMNLKQGMADVKLLLLKMNEQQLWFGIIGGNEMVRWEFRGRKSKIAPESVGPDVCGPTQGRFTICLTVVDAEGRPQAHLPVPKMIERGDE